MRARGLEPLILAEPDPKSGVSANSTTRAYAVADKESKARRLGLKLKKAFPFPSKLPKRIAFPDEPPIDLVNQVDLFVFELWNGRISLARRE